MIGLRRTRRDTACEHHWHVTDAGWECCCCPGRVKAKDSPPAAGTAACRAEFDEPGIAAWLAPPRSFAAATGHRPGRPVPRGTGVKRLRAS